MNDPIGDMATRIRNGLQNEFTHVDVPISKLKLAVADVMQREGYIWDYENVSEAGVISAKLRLNLKYGPSGERVLRSIRRISKPGRRIYFGVGSTPKVLGGTGIYVLSTNRGVVSSREAAKLFIGGEVLLEVW